MQLTFYWFDFFIWGNVIVEYTDIFFIFKKSYLLADSWTAISALLSIYGLLYKKNWGVLMGIISGTNLIVIGCLDLLYNLNKHNYALVTTNYAMLFEATMTISCFVFGIVIISYLWVNRHKLMT